MLSLRFWSPYPRFSSWWMDYRPTLHIRRDERRRWRSIVALHRANLWVFTLPRIERHSGYWTVDIPRVDRYGDPPLAEPYSDEEESC